ncbi:beta-1,3-galactosyltransferase 5-like [Ptychodera flava]|uniref:beta-1,3-galactosyltransferase 5-like n=1 Tax=Ptychodera flava TaxID=63121 RepID=UPI00396A00DC
MVLFVIVRFKVSYDSDTSKTLAKNLRAIGLARFFGPAKAKLTQHRSNGPPWKVKAAGGYETYTSKYVINHRHICEMKNGGRVFILFLVTSHPEHFHRRKGIRETWGKRSPALDEPIRLLFVLGRPRNVSDEAQKQILMENEEYGDIVQSDFIDVPRNATLKTMVGMEWAVKHCKNAQFVIKSTDTMFLNIPNIVQKLKTVNLPSTVLCYVIKNSKPIRDEALIPDHPEYVISADLYPEKIYPPYCSGNFIIMPIDTVIGLYATSLIKPLLPGLEDVNLGLLAGALNVSLMHDVQLGEAFVNHDEKKPCLLKRAIASFINFDPSVENYNKLWSAVNDDSIKC